MDVTVIGGGPGGLYAALLVKQERPDWDVTVYERDPADNTYGWGVVFSDATLSNLKEADAASHEAVTDAFARWDPIDTYVGGERFRCGGHGFAGIMRADLLAILQDRCREVGVDLHFDHAVEDVDAYREECDVLVGADGLDSTVRETYADRFRPSVTHGDAKFVWLGTDKPFDVFTFVFRENEHGLWRVHAYPGRKSTFIVECTEATWRAAGMDERGEDDAIAYFEDLFADHLAGYGLEAKLYQWRNFPVVECDRWSTDDVVLVGDAAHTAHFTIGSGTKMAMEDAIALLEAFREHGTDYRSAFDWYAKERGPRVEGLQAAGERSRRYFETVERYTDLAPRRFAFNLLTRSGRISYEELKRRDPAFADRYDRWFEGHEGIADATPVVATPPQFKPLDLREVTVPNRVVLTGDVDDAASEGVPAEATRDRLVEHARGAAGLVLTQPLAVRADGRITPGTPGLYDDEQRDAWTGAVERVHGGSAGGGSAGAPAGDDSTTVAGAHLVHAGRRGASRPRRYGLDRPLPDGEGWELVAPSAKPYAPGRRQPRAMDESDLAAVREAFVDAAGRADAAGFDYLQVHAGHGYLLSQFLSQLSNERDDEYGGSVAERMAYPLAVVESVREAWPDGKPLGVTLQVTDWNLNGWKTHHADRFGAALAERGVDLLAPVAGGTTYRESPRYDATTLVDFSDRVRNGVGVPTLSTAHATTFDDVNTQVGAGRADLCTFAPPEMG